MSDISKIFEECKFISKKDEWFVEGTEVKFICLIGFPHSPITRFKDGSALMEGYTNETFKGYAGELPRLDQDGSSLDEFNIIHKSGIEITNLTPDEFKMCIRSKKIMDVLHTVLKKPR